MHRRSYLALCATGLAGGCIGRSGEKGTPTPGAVTLEPVVTGLQEPVSVTPHPDESDTYFVADRYGFVRKADSNGDTRTVVDVSDDVELQSWEQGLVGMALHPSFESTRKAYVHYSGGLREGMSSENSHAFVLAEFTLDESFESTTGTRTLLEFPEPEMRHNGGELAFDGDGNLLVTVGDGGDQADKGQGHASDWYDDLEGGNGQDVTENLLGSVLRIDPDRTGGEKPYGIPDDNPLVGETGLDEQYAWGFRNPYSISRHGDRLFVADVGQDWYEELNLVEAGGNYGWNVREGPDCYVPGEGEPVESATCPDSTADGAPLRDPILTYAHADDEGSTAVIGGHVYDGETLPFLQGKYLFADIMSDGAGQLFAATERDDGTWSDEELSIDVADADSFDEAILGFGRDAAGELYLCTTNFQKEGEGTVYRLAPAYP